MGGIGASDEYLAPAQAVVNSIDVEQALAAWEAPLAYVPFRLSEIRCEISRISMQRMQTLGGVLGA